MIDEGLAPAAKYYYDSVIEPMLQEQREKQSAKEEEEENLENKRKYKLYLPDGDSIKIKTVCSIWEAIQELNRATMGKNFHGFFASFVLTEVLARFLVSTSTLCLQLDVIGKRSKNEYYLGKECSD